LRAAGRAGANARCRARARAGRRIAMDRARRECCGLSVGYLDELFARGGHVLRLGVHAALDLLEQPRHLLPQWNERLSRQQGCE
jgi:hypothetical protein